MFKKLFSLFTSSKRRKYKGTKRFKASKGSLEPDFTGKSFGKRSRKRRTRRVYPKGMRGGWGEPMDTLPEMLKKDGVTKNGIMKGGWGEPIS